MTRLPRRLPTVLFVAALLLLGGAATLAMPGEGRMPARIPSQTADQAAPLAARATPTPAATNPAVALTRTPAPATVTPSPEPFQPASATEARLTVTPTSSSTPFPPVGNAQLARFVPATLVIPRIGVEATIVPVGVSAEGQLEAPGDYATVGWYAAGPLPGEPGRAVIDGHLDSRTGPAVFYRLSELVPGDEIVVRMGAGRADETFVVRESAAFWTGEAPLDRIYGPSDRAELVLITCGGPFDRSGGGYQQRRIVFAEQRESSPS